MYTFYCGIYFYFYIYFHFYFHFHSLLSFRGRACRLGVPGGNGVTTYHMGGGHVHDGNAGASLYDGSGAAVGDADGGIHGERAASEGVRQSGAVAVLRQACALLLAGCAARGVGGNGQRDGSAAVRCHPQQRAGDSVSTVFGAFLIASAIYYAADRIVTALDGLAVELSAGDDDEEEPQPWES